MKKSLLIPLCLCCSLILWGCSPSDEDQTDPTKLQVNVFEDIRMDKDGSTRVIPILAHSAWSADTPAQWLTLTPGNGVLTITAEANKTLEERTTIVTVRLNDYDKTFVINIVQPHRAAPYIYVYPLELNNIPANGNEYTIFVETPQEIEWDYSIEGDPDWIVILTRNATSATFLIEKNIGDSRSALIVFEDEDGDARQEVPVSQMSVAGYDENDPTTYGYTLMQALTADQTLDGKHWSEYDAYMKQYMFEYSENPNCVWFDDGPGEHLAVVYDAAIDQYAFKFTIHSNSQVIDGDLGVREDSQRNEMKSCVNSEQDYKDVNGNWDEWQILEWKMMIPADFQASTAFTHIHQLKGEEGTNVDSPLITLTLRENDNSSRLQIIHTGRELNTTKSIIYDGVPLSELGDEWVQVREEIHYHDNGLYRLKITRLSDNAILLDYADNNLDMWRIGGAINICSRFGIYRNVGGNPFGSLNLKDEDIWFTDFKVYERNSNPEPEPHED